MHQGWIPQSLPCHTALFCHRKGTNSFPKAWRALIGGAVAHRYALGAKQGSSCCTLKMRESCFTALWGQIALGRALTFLFLVLGRCRTSSVGYRSVLSSAQTMSRCVNWLHETHYSSIIFLPFLLIGLLSRFLVYLSRGQQWNCCFFNYSFGRPVLHMTWKPPL